uniref:Uncharacterized protein n=1 Tax=Tanacetum cinerariifolium TaxID=118510 RepID=A0A699I6J9_TANCI|nr:hypothetical protein [Tanacetum cinerariifolium]
MDDLNINMVRYFEDINYFKDFENQFPAIIYNDALTPKLEVLYDFKNEFPAIVYNVALASEAEVSSEHTRILRYGYGVSTSCTALGILTPLQHTFLLIDATWRIIPSKS